MIENKASERSFWIASEDEILSGAVTDVYFERVAAVLASRDKNPFVRAEVRAASLPKNWPWAVLAGVEELCNLFKGKELTIDAAPEGSFFHAGDPVVMIEGRYLDLCIFETALLGILCQASGVATQAARCRKLAEGRPIYSFGARRMHPAIAPMIDRSAFIGGCDAVAVTKSAELLHEIPVGTMAHSLMICMGDDAEAFRAFDEAIDGEVPRVALVDTFSDEKFGALAAAEALGDRLWGVRLDTPTSRRGDFRRIAEEVRWELDLRGFKHVRIIVSGGINEAAILDMNPVVDGYGIGTFISNAPVVDFGMDIIEVDGEPRAKRGKDSGSKSLWRCPVDAATRVTPKGHPAPVHCGRPMQLLNKRLVDQGYVAQLPKPRTIREEVIQQLGRVSTEVLVK